MSTSSKADESTSTTGSHLDKSTSTTGSHLDESDQSKTGFHSQPDECTPSTQAVESGKSAKTSPKSLNFCTFCHTTINRFWEHMTRKHGNEKKIEGIVFIKSDKRRKLAIEKFRKNCKDEFNRRNPTKPLCERHLKFSKKEMICIFCGTKVEQLWKHMSVEHRKEQKISEIFSIEDKKQRRLEINKLRRDCNLRSTNSPTEPLGSIVPFIEKNLGKCHKCGALISKCNLKRHSRKCTFVPRAEASHPVPEEGCAKEELVMQGGKLDAVQKVYSSDNLLMLYVKHKCVSEKWSVDRANEIRSHLRQICKMFLRMQAIDKTIHDFESIFEAEKWPVFKQALNDLAGRNEKGEVKYPSVLSKCGFFIRTLYKVFEVHCKGPKLEQLKRWYAFYELEHYPHLVKTGLSTANRRKRNVTVQLPLSSDVAILNKFLVDKSTQLSKSLKRGFSPSRWQKFGNCLATLLMLTNVRRLNEIPLLTLDVYEKRHLVPISEDYILSNKEKERASAIYRLEFEGKCGNTVVLLMPSNTVKMTDQLVSLRQKAIISGHSKLLFTTSEGNKINLNRALSKLAIEAGCKKPELLRSRKLRKKFAQKSQRMNMSEEDKHGLTKILSHSRATFETHYNLPDPVLQVTRLSSFIDASLENRTEDFQNRDLKSIGTPAEQSRATCSRFLEPEDEDDKTSEEDDSDEDDDDKTSEEDDSDEDDDEILEKQDDSDEDDDEILEKQDDSDEDDDDEILEKQDDSDDDNNKILEKQDDSDEDDRTVDDEKKRSKETMQVSLLQTPVHERSVNPDHLRPGTSYQVPVTPDHLRPGTSYQVPVTPDRLRHVTLPENSSPRIILSPLTPNLQRLQSRGFRITPSPLKKTQHTPPSPLKKTQHTPPSPLKKTQHTPPSPLEKEQHKTRIKWTPKETKFIKQHFAFNIRHLKGISKAEARLCKMYPALRQRTSYQIYNKTNNMIKALRRRFL